VYTLTHPGTKGCRRGPHRPASVTTESLLFRTGGELN
jgi:hypothetical protein